MYAYVYIAQKKKNCKGERTFIIEPDAPPNGINEPNVPTPAEAFS